MAGTVMPYVKMQWLTDAGAIASGYQLFTYAAGTANKQNTWSDADMTALNTNPVVLDSAGRANVFLDTLAYKFVLALPTAADPPAAGDVIWTVDDVSAVPDTFANLDIEGTAGEDLVVGDFVFLSDGTGALTAGRWYKTDADNTWSSTMALAIGCVREAITADSTGTIRLQGKITGLAGLVAGSGYFLSATAGALVAAAPTNARHVGIAESASVLILNAWAATVLATNNVPGLLSTIAQYIKGEKTFINQPIIPGGAGATGYVSGVLNSQYSSDGIATTGGAGGPGTVLFTYTMAANTFAAHATGTNRPALRVSWKAGFLADTDVKLMSLTFGATTLEVVNQGVNLASNIGHFTVIIQRVDATHQYLYGSGIIATQASSGGVGYVVANQANSSTDETAAIVISVVGANSTDATSGSIVAKSFLVELVG